VAAVGSAGGREDTAEREALERIADLSGSWRDIAVAAHCIAVDALPDRASSLCAEERVGAREDTAQRDHWIRL
jgi:hypothetical protein